VTEPQITTKDVVLNLDRKVDGLIADMADVKVIAGTVGTTVTMLHDHEMRIRSLERFRYAIPSVALLGLLATVAFALYSIAVH
jgi:ABC-type proline/glycine betaine transport system permease subunit